MFNLLYDACENGWLTLWTKQDKKTYWFQISELAKAAETAKKLSINKDVYFGIGLRCQKVSGRGDSDNICTIPGLWIDIDIKGEAHNQEALPPTLEAAIGLLKQFPLYPSILVNSGHGLHGYWLFKEPWTFEDDTERQEAADLLRRFQATIQDLAKERGWKLDTTSDLARVLRVPGTKNFKEDPPSDVTILEQNDVRYNPSDFEPYLREIVASEVAANKPIITGPVQLIIERCKFIQHCRDDAATLSEPEWYAMISNLGRASGGVEKVHEFSKPYTRYNPKETDDKIKHAIEDGHPHTCEYIQNSLHFNCPPGGCGVKAPVALAMNPVAIAKSKVAQISIDTVFEAETIGALAILKKQEPAEYARIKQQLKGKVNLNDLERAVNKQVAENQKLHIVGEGEEPTAIAEILPELPIKELRKPYAWTLNVNGVWQDNKDGPICACAVPVILTQRLKNVDTGEERVELAFYRDSKWHYITAERSVVFSRTAIVQLADKSLPVSTESSKHLVRYLQDLERENLNVLPVRRTTNHMGWVGKNFVPGAAGDLILDLKQEGSATVAGGYRESGTLEEWIEAVAPLREFPIARFAIATSFAAPLLKLVDQRIFIVHIWGPSLGGKTSAIKAALSVWGNPEDLIANFNATKVGIERLAAFYSDLPLCIDERQVVGDKQGFIESMVYLLGLGKGKARGAKNGGLQAFSTWQTAVLTTGEQPLSTDNSTAGIKTRVLEMYGKPIPNEEVARAIHIWTEKYFGTAGPAFIRRIIEELAKEPNAFRDDYEQIQKILAQKAPMNIASHIAAVTVVCMADYYASIWLFGMDETEAYLQAMDMGETILSMLETAMDADDSERAYEYLLSWYGANASAFNSETARERYGLIDKQYIYIFPSIFERAMKDGGFNSNRILNDWADKDLIKTEVRGGKKRLKVRKADPETHERLYFIAVKLPEDNESGPWPTSGPHSGPQENAYI